jgi:glutamate-1-semialdehyde 2,1-aminomutase
VADRFVAACVQMKGDGWWWHDGTLSARSIRRMLLLEMLRARR